MKANGLYFSVLASILLAGCATNIPAPVVGRPLPAAPAASIATPGAAVPGKDQVQVKRGETLYSIAREHQIDVRELAAWNQIDNPGKIAVGQILRIKAPGATAAAGNDAVVVARPIGSSAVIEIRPLDGRPASSAPPIPANPVSIPAAVPGSVAVVPAIATDKLKREPRVGKIAYSDEAWARAQGLPAPAVPAASATVPPPVAPVTSVALAPSAPEIKAEAKPEVSPPPAEVSGDDFHWIWPVSGKQIGSFSESGGKGIDLSGKAGEPVLAAGSGKVVYSGTGLRGYGKLVIVKHNATYLSAYAHNQAILVKEGQSVTQGQKIAEMGNTDADRVKLHFEIRRQGKPVDPVKYLPRR